MKISVLMSVYYKEKPEYLDKAIESIVNQTLKPNQIVIIKDGKLTDDLEKVLDKYKNENMDLIEIYNLDSKKGLGEALKYGTMKCKYEYIARMDTDDIAPFYRFEKQVEILEKNPSLDILGGYIEEYDEEMKKLISIRKVPLTKEEIKKYIKTQSPFNHGTVIMKKETLIKVGGYNNVALEDYDLWARFLISDANMANMDIILGKNRTGKSMYERRSGIKQVKKVLQIEKNLLNYKIINKVEYFKNVIIRTVFALTPVGLKKVLYKKLRK